jgi:hypothetical protein
MRLSGKAWRLAEPNSVGRKADTLDQRGKTRVGAQRIEAKIHQEVGHPFVAGLISLLEPRKGSLLFDKPGLDQSLRLRQEIAKSAPFSGTPLVQWPFVYLRLHQRPVGFRIAWK